MSALYSLIFRNERGSCGLPKLHDYIYFWFDIMITIVVALLAYLFTSDLLLKVYIGLICVHILIIMSTSL